MSNKEPEKVTVICSGSSSFGVVAVVFWGFVAYAFMPAVVWLYRAFVERWEECQ